MAGGGTSYIELYANSLNSDNNYNSPYYQTLDIGEALPIPSEISMTNPPYVFTKWNTARDGSGTSYNPGDIINNEIVLYAQWDYPAEEYNIISNHSLIDLATSIKKKTKQCPAPLLSINQMISTIDNLDTSNINLITIPTPTAGTAITRANPFQIQACQANNPFSFVIAVNGNSSSSTATANNIWLFLYNSITNTLTAYGMGDGNSSPVGSFDTTTGILTIQPMSSNRTFYLRPGSSSYGTAIIRGWGFY